MDKILAAAFIAVAAHKSAKRADGVTPYVLHPLRVAMGVSAYTKDKNVIAAAILHDVVEDTNMTIKTLRHIFNDTVADLVEELTIPKRVKRKKKYVLAKKFSPMARLIKLNDALDNLIDLDTANWPDEKKAEYRKYLDALIKKLNNV